MHSQVVAIPHPVAVLRSNSGSRHRRYLGCCNLRYSIPGLQEESMVVRRCYSHSKVPVDPCTGLVHGQPAFYRLPIRFRGMGSGLGDGADER